MELNRKQIKSQARILVQNKWGALFVITFVVMVLTGMGMFNNSQIDLVKQISIIIMPATMAAGIIVRITRWMSLISTIRTRTTTRWTILTAPAPLPR